MTSTYRGVLHLLTRHGRRRLEIVFLSVLGRALLEVVWGCLGDAGHKESPLCPTPLKTGWVLASRNPVAMDTVLTALLGFDFRRIPQVAKAYELRNYPLVLFRPEDVEVVGLPGVSTVGDIYVSRSFVSADPSRGWKGHAEYVPDELHPVSLDTRLR